MEIARIVVRSEEKAYVMKEKSQNEIKTHVTQTKKNINEIKSYGVRKRIKRMTREERRRGDKNTQ